MKKRLSAKIRLTLLSLGLVALTGCEAPDSLDEFYGGWRDSWNFSLSTDTLVQYLGQPLMILFAMAFIVVLVGAAYLVFGKKFGSSGILQGLVSMLAIFVLLAFPRAINSLINLFLPEELLLDRIAAMLRWSFPTKGIWANVALHFTLFLPYLYRLAVIYFIVRAIGDIFNAIVESTFEGLTRVFIYMALLGLSLSGFGIVIFVMEGTFENANWPGMTVGLSILYLFLVTLVFYLFLWKIPQRLDQIFQLRLNQSQFTAEIDGGGSRSDRIVEEAEGLTGTSGADSYEQILALGGLASALFTGRRSTESEAQVTQANHRTVEEMPELEGTDSNEALEPLLEVNPSSTAMQDLDDSAAPADRVFDEPSNGEVERDLVERAPAVSEPVISPGMVTTTNGSSTELLALQEETGEPTLLEFAGLAAGLVVSGLTDTGPTTSGLRRLARTSDGDKDTGQTTRSTTTVTEPMPDNLVETENTPRTRETRKNLSQTGPVETAHPVVDASIPDRETTPQQLEKTAEPGKERMDDFPEVIDLEGRRTPEENSATEPFPLSPFSNMPDTEHPERAKRESLRAVDPDDYWLKKTVKVTVQPSSPRKELPDKPPKPEPKTRPQKDLEMPDLDLD